MNRSKLIVYKKTSDNIVLNPTFTSTSNWTTTNFTINTTDNVIQKTVLSAGTFYQNSVLATDVKLYRAELSVDRLSGSIQVNIGGNVKTISVAGKYNIDVWKNSTTDISVVAGANTTVTISSFKIFELNTYELDLYDEQMIEITYQSLDVNNLFQRKSDFSKDLVLPNTPKNQAFFNHSYDMSVVGSFEFNAQSQCKVYYDTTEIFDGYFELTNIQRIDHDNKVEYNCLLFSTLKYFLDNLGSAKLRGNDNASFDLDLSRYNHTLTTDHITNSWTNLIFKDGTEQQLANGEGYVYSLVDRGNMGLAVDIPTMVPTIYNKQILDLICEKNGITYNSTYLNSDYFKKQVYLKLEQNYISEAEIDNREFITYNGTTPQSLFSTDDRWFTNAPRETVLLNNIVKDNYNAYNQFNGDYVVPKGGIYDISCFLTILGTATNNTSYPLQNKNTLFSDPQSALDTSTYNVPIILVIEKNGSLIYQEEISFDWNIGYDTIILPADPKNQNLVVEKTITDEPLNEGDTIRIRVECHPHVFKMTSYQNQSYEVTMDYDFSVVGITGADNALNITANEKSLIAPGEIVDITNYLDKSQTQKQFVEDIFNMANLFVYSNKLNPNVLYIEPYTTFWGATSLVNNWSYKRDQASDFLIEDASDLRFKNIKFTYSEDEDVLNQSYLTDTQKIIGQYYDNRDYQFKDIYKIELYFASTAMENYLGSDVSTGINAFVTPNLNFNEVGSVSINKDAQSRPRCLFYNGLKTPSRNFILKENTTYTTQYLYPLFSTFEDLDGGANGDLNWDMCEYYFQNNLSTITTENLYHKYYKKYIDELLDIDTKKVTCWLALTEVDIYNFNFNQKVEIDGIYYRVLSINNFNPNKLTEVVLVKMKEVALTFPAKKRPPRPWTWIQHKIEIGKNNFIQTGAGVIGDDNHIQQGGHNIMVIGDRNYVEPNAVDIFSFGNDNSELKDNSFNVNTTKINLFADSIRIFKENPYLPRPVYLNANGELIYGRASMMHIVDDNYSEFNPIVNVHIVDSGLDIVRGTNSVNNIFIIDDTEDDITTQSNIVYQ